MNPVQTRECRRHVNGLSGWCVRSNRLASNPLQGIAKADITSDRRLTRRAMTEAELHRLLHMARWRPLAELGRESVKTDAEDIHAIRTTFGTHLNMAAVSLRTAQAAMRHSDPMLTANIYADQRLLDVHEAVEALPMLSLTMTRQDAPEVFRATGTESQLAPLLAPTSGKLCLSVAYTGTHAEQFHQMAEATHPTKRPRKPRCRHQVFGVLMQ